MQRALAVCRPATDKLDSVSQYSGIDIFCLAVDMHHSCDKGHISTGRLSVAFSLSCHLTWILLHSSLHVLFSKPRTNSSYQNSPTLAGWHSV